MNCFKCDICPPILTQPLEIADSLANQYAQLYAFYKQGTQDPPIEKSEVPGMFDLKVPLVLCLPSTSFPLIAESFYPKGKAKKRAWQNVVDDGVTPNEAQSSYVKLVESLKETYGYDADKEPEAVGAAS
jgi:diazepam-binding inhibitor (GABA receptor modulator, acyl-CoA-binding protein)